MTQPKIQSYGPQDMVFPEYRLLQNTGGKEAKQAGGKPGQFYHTLRGDFSNEITCSVVDIMKVRTRWGSDILDQPPECASADADAMVSLDGQDCSQCEYRCDNPWAVVAARRRELCTVGYVLQGVDLEHDYQPFIFRAHGVSAIAMRELISSLRFNRQLQGEPWRGVIRLTAVAKQTSQGEVYAIKARPVGLVNEEQQRELTTLIPQLVGAPMAQMLEAGEGVVSLPSPLEAEKTPVEGEPEGEPGFTLDF